MLSQIENRIFRFWALPILLAVGLHARAQTEPDIQDICYGSSKPTEEQKTECKYFRAYERYKANYDEESAEGLPHKYPTPPKTMLKIVSEIIFDPTTFTNDYEKVKSAMKSANDSQTSAVDQGGDINVDRNADTNPKSREYYNSGVGRDSSR